jgi:hypothetical protein
MLYLMPSHLAKLDLMDCWPLVRYSPLVRPSLGVEVESSRRLLLRRPTEVHNAKLGLAAVGYSSVALDGSSVAIGSSAAIDGIGRPGGHFEQKVPGLDKCKLACSERSTD